MTDLTSQFIQFLYLAMFLGLIFGLLLALFKNRI